jgi:poly(A)-specific ribonuclease
MEAFHEAGYDSLLTAKIMLRLATKVDHQEKLDRGNSVITDATAIPGVTSLERSSMASVVPLPAPSEDLRPSTNGIAGTPGLSPQSPSNHHHHNTQVHALEIKPLLKDDGHDHVRKTFQGGKLIVQDITDVLEGIHFEPKQIRDETQNRFGILRDQMDSGHQAAELSWGLMTSESDNTKVYDLDPIKWSPMEVLPMFNSDFWTRFGNRLRIFGTQETVLHIADWENPIERNRVSTSPINW